MKYHILYSIIFNFFLLFSTYSYSADLENGKQLFKSCTLCHGAVGQGIKGGDFPKIGGLPEYYLNRQLKLFVEEKRFNPAMVTIGRLDSMTDKEKENLAAYVASIDIQKEAPSLTIPTFTGNAKKGKKLFKGDCKTCHGSKAEGKSKKAAPPSAWQYSEYLLRQIDFFKSKDRLHQSQKDEDENEDEDETFVEYTQEEITDILTFISTLDDQIH
ncbi:MAG: cytochrome c [gamma proteobacterium symbiont of Taylorina sp.]|nr:cytochrome c [gamma proteobacterium symbiont of Taylorina sp.]